MDFESTDGYSDTDYARTVLCGFCNQNWSGCGHLHHIGGHTGSCIPPPPENGKEQKIGSWGKILHYDQQKLREQLKEKKNLTVLAVESSCDETAIAVVRNGRTVLSNTVHSQIEEHKKYGGVVPEIASRQHVLATDTLLEQALEEAGLGLEDMDAIAVTCGPGLVGALLVGVSFAKALAYARNLPLIGVNHIEGHICANYITHPDLEPPFLCLVASGGHSHIVHVEDYGKYRLIGATRDDAAGEALDKVARVLGLPYPGGPELEKLAREGDETRYSMPGTFNAGEHFNLSFSGLKTAVINLLHRSEQKGETLNRADVAASFQHWVTQVLAEKTAHAAQMLQLDIAVGGGVSANAALREAIRAQAPDRKIYFPEMKYCGDNAAMIGCAGYYRLRNGETSGLDLNASPGLSLF